MSAAAVIGVRRSTNPSSRFSNSSTLSSAKVPSRSLALTPSSTEPACSHAALAAPRSASNSAIIGSEMTKKVPCRALPLSRVDGIAGTAERQLGFCQQLIARSLKVPRRRPRNAEAPPAKVVAFEELFELQRTVVRLNMSSVPTRHLI
jgi:hypothetical protein